MPAVQHYDIIEPYLSDENGRFHGYHLEAKTKEALPSNKLHYVIPLSDMTLLLSVAPTKQSASQEITIETHHSNGTVGKNTKKMDVLVGNVVSHPGSFVAISNDNGLVRIQFVCIVLRKPASQ